MTDSKFRPKAFGDFLSAVSGERAKPGPITSSGREAIPSAIPTGPTSIIFDAQAHVGRSEGQCHPHRVGPRVA
jgi:hypothetical protein